MERFMLKVRGEGKNSGEEEEVSGCRLQTSRAEEQRRLQQGPDVTSRPIRDGQ